MSSAPIITIPQICGCNIYQVCSQHYADTWANYHHAHSGCYAHMPQTPLPTNISVPTLPSQPPQISHSSLRTGIEALKDAYPGVPNLALLHHLLNPGPQTPAALSNALIISLDFEWFEFSPAHITELGVSVLDLSTTSHFPCAASPWEILAWGMKAHHVRIKEYAHMVNKKLCPGHPDKFAFGQTRFVGKADAEEVLKGLFSQPCETTDAQFCCVETEQAHDEGYLSSDSQEPEHGNGSADQKEQGRQTRPIILLGHALDNDTAKLKEHFGLDIDALGTVVATLDTRDLAQEAGLVPQEREVGLWALLEMLGFSEGELHTAGNDAACTLVAAVLVAALTKGGIAVPHEMGSENQALYEWVKGTVGQRMEKEGDTIGGDVVFCTRCSSGEHLDGACTAELCCEKCAKKEDKCAGKGSHSTRKCTERLEERYYRNPPPKRPAAASPKVKSPPLPCMGCELSTNRKRWRVSMTHAEEDCMFRYERAVNGVCDAMKRLFSLEISPDNS